MLCCLCLSVFVCVVEFCVVGVLSDFVSGDDVCVCVVVIVVVKCGVLVFGVVLEEFGGMVSRGLARATMARLRALGVLDVVVDECG